MASPIDHVFPIRRVVDSIRRLDDLLEGLEHFLTDEKLFDFSKRKGTHLFSIIFKKRDIFHRVLPVLD